MKGESVWIRPTIASCCRFNPRPSVMKGESRGCFDFGGALPEFQSTPLSDEGRISVTGAALSADKLFQSTPLSDEGRIPQGWPLTYSYVSVSIHAPQ